jgi:hypothetical protein
MIACDFGYVMCAGAISMPSWQRPLEHGNTTSRDSKAAATPQISKAGWLGIGQLRQIVGQ